MLPESSKIRKEILLRELQLPEGATATRMSLLRWIALSLGLISPGESRLILLDVLDALFYFYFKGEQPTSKEILDYVKKRNPNVSEKSVFYHLNRLKENGLIISKDRKYTFNIPSDLPSGLSLGSYLQALYQKRCHDVLENVKEVVDTLGKRYE